MLTAGPCPRAGATLLELLVVMVVGGVALTLVAMISTRQQRTLADLADGAALSGQLRDAASVLPVDLRSASVIGGDIRDARDTAIELRATIASAVVCDTAPGGVALSPATEGPGAFGGYLTAPDIGDTAWVLAASDSAGGWSPYRVTAIGTAAPGACALLGPALDNTARSVGRPTIALDHAPSLQSLVGIPVRVTRPLRYSLYRASDGAWYLGERDWNAATQRFNTIQPVSGPYLSPALGGLRLRYYDSAGAAIPVPVPDPRTISLITMEVRGQTRSAARVLGSGSVPARRVDSVSALILMRNRR